MPEEKPLLSRKLTIVANKVYDKETGEEISGTVVLSCRSPEYVPDHEDPISAIQRWSEFRQARTP